jgi:hypothetical protein
LEAIIVVKSAIPIGLACYKATIIKTSGGRH